MDGAWAIGDTIEAFDSDLLRITRFLPDGTVETVRLDPGGAGYLPNVAIPGRFCGDWLVTGVTGQSPSQQLEIAVARFSGTGEFEGTIERMRGPEMYSAAGVHGPTPLSPMAFSDVARDALYLGETIAPVIRVVDCSGVTAREVTWEPDRKSPRSTLDRVIELAVERVDPGEEAGLRRRLEAAPIPEGVPTFSEFMVDQLGFVWVRPFEVDRDAPAPWGPEGAFKSRAGGDWWIFSPDGEKSGSIEIPADLEPYQITDRAVVGIRRDDFGVEYVQVHQVHRRPLERQEVHPS